MNEPIRIFIGYDRIENLCWHVLNHSIMTRAHSRVQIVPLMLSQLGGLLWRDRDPLQSNDFSFSRWLVPYLCDYKGSAIFMDCDMLCLDDIDKLWAMRDSLFAIQCVKHNYNPKGAEKYLGRTQTVYPKKNWSSMMLFNNERCKALTLDYVNTASGLDLHQFKWLEDDALIGGLPFEWNYLVNYYQEGTPRLLHWTDFGPWLKDHLNVQFADKWKEELIDMLYVKEA